MAGMTPAWLHGPLARVGWEGRRAVRRLGAGSGPAWLLAGLAAALLLSAWWLREAQHERWQRASRAAASADAPAPATAAPTSEPDGRARLRAFDARLPPHDDIPSVLQELILLAEAQGLVLARGAYRPQVDAQGGYLRYRMTLPVTGPADAVQRFMMAALRSQATLSLESVQFKRERRDTSVVEARIQWALLTRLPAVPAPRGVTTP